MTKFRNREGIQAVNAENRTFEALQGSYVDNGVEVSTDGTDMTLDITSGTVVQSNTEHGIGATTVTVPDNNEAEPRKDIVYVDDAQSVSVATGASEIPDPELEKVESVFNTARPSPPSLVNQDDVVVLAEVWVEAGATEITSEELEDRRLTLGLETGGGDDSFTVNWTRIDLPDLEEHYGHGPITITGEKEIEIHEVNLGTDDGTVPQGLSIQLLDVAGDGEPINDRDQYVLAEFDSNYEKGDPIQTVAVEDKTVVLTLVNSSGDQRFAGGFARVSIE